MSIILVCEDSLEGIFTGIYEAYARKCSPADTKLQIGETGNYELFAEYISIESDPQKACKVSATINRDFGADIFMQVCRAIASEDAMKGDAVYHMVAAGLLMRNKRNAMSNLADSYIHKIFELDRYTANEIHHLCGFLRFQEMKNGILVSKIGPRNNILTFLAVHFADRLPLENFLIYDDIRRLLVIHPAGKDWFVVTGEHLEEENLTAFSDKELEYQELFKYFCHKIAIKERINLRLQRQMLPLRFQEYMVEFK